MTAPAEEFCPNCENYIGTADVCKACGWSDKLPADENVGYQ